MIQLKNCIGKIKCLLPMYFSVVTQTAFSAQGKKKPTVPCAISPPWQLHLMQYRVRFFWKPATGWAWASPPVLSESALLNHRLMGQSKQNTQNRSSLSRWMCCYWCVAKLVFIYIYIFLIVYSLFFIFIWLCLDLNQSQSYPCPYHQWLMLHNPRARWFLIYSIQDFGGMSSSRWTMPCLV